MTKYKIKIGQDEKGIPVYEVYLGFCTESEKGFYSQDQLNRYFEIQERTGRKIESINVLKINGQEVRARRLEEELRSLAICG